MDWIRLHKPPKKCRCVDGVKKDARSRYLYKMSLERFLNNHERRNGYKIIERSLRNGMIGEIDSFRMIY